MDRTRRDVIGTVAATALRRLVETVPDPALGYNRDTGGTLLQRDNPPMALDKVRKHPRYTPWPDRHGPRRECVHDGRGVMAARAGGYQGFAAREPATHPGDGIG
jgi:hypothetical protein